MTTMKTKESARFSLRLTDELRSRIQAEAEIQRRTEANLVKAILEDYFYNLDRAKKIAEKK